MNSILKVNIYAYKYIVIENNGHGKQEFLVKNFIMILGVLVCSIFVFVYFISRTESTGFLLLLAFVVLKQLL